MAAPTTSLSPRPVLGAVVARRTWLATIHVVLSFIVSVIPFALVVTGLSLTLGLAVTVVLAVPALWLTLVVADLFAAEERARFRAVLGVGIAAVEPPPLASPWARLWRRVSSASSWMRVAWSLLLLPLASVGLAVVIGAWSGSLALLALPAYVGLLPGETAHFGLFDLHAGPAALLAVPVGLVGLVAAAWIARGWAGLEALLARQLLGSRTTAQLEERIDTLETSRAYAVDAAEAERRRIERDLHDGAQQRLVALALDLGMAREKFESDPEQAKALIDEAHVEAKRALAELRDLARGIHPVALSDRGLAGAVPGLAGRCPLPVDVHVDIPERPPAAVEGIAYFIVSEALANVVKHAGATQVRVSAVARDGRLVVEVADDGRGGADPGAGSGLAGLGDRAASIDGHLEVLSPPGGPTVVRAELPCGS